MAHLPFDKVVEEVKALSPAEQRQLWFILDAIVAGAGPLREDEFAHKLVEFGLLSEVKPPIADFTPYQNRQPVKTTGKHLSEVILEERR
jgi:hypothetical protein